MARWRPIVSEFFGVEQAPLPTPHQQGWRALDRLDTHIFWIADHDTPSMDHDGSRGGEATEMRQLIIAKWLTVSGNLAIVDHVQLIMCRSLSRWL